jgi:hypothetical protein
MRQLALAKAGAPAELEELRAERLIAQQFVDAHVVS